MEKSCDNCKYFERHYAVTDGGFCAVNCGHCKNIKRNCNKSIKYSEFGLCSLWENGEQEIAERKEKIVAALNNMNWRIDEITDIFDKKGKL